MIEVAAVILAAALPGQCNELDPPRFTEREVRCVIRRVWPPVLVAPATRVARCESKLKWWAYNHQSGASGIYQFLPSTWRNPWNPHRKQSPFNVVANVRAAYRLYIVTGNNWSQWQCKP